MSARSLLKDLLPPKLVTLVRRLNPDWRYIGADSAALNASGWDHPSVAEAQLRKWPRWQEIVTSTGPLGVAHEAPVLRNDSVAAHNVLLTYAYVVALASHNRDELSVLDWGGGLGHYHSVARALVPDVQLAYTIMEVPGIVGAARTLDTPAQFVVSDQPLLDRSYDLVVASASLHYARDWSMLLTALARASRDYLYIGRLPVVAQGRSFIAVQRAHRYGYQTEYGGWCLNRADLVAAAATAGVRLVREFVLEEHPYIAGAPEQPTSAGFLFRRNGEPG